MSRKKLKIKPRIIADPVFGDFLVSSIINKLMFSGKKSVAEKIFYNSLTEIEKKIKTEPAIDVVKRAVDNLKPSIEVKSRRIGGATYQVPIDVRPSRRLALALRWLIKNSRARKEKSMAMRFAGEIMDAYGSKGVSIKKKEDVHKMAEANKAFSHYSW